MGRLAGAVNDMQADPCETGSPFCCAQQALSVLYFPLAPWRTGSRAMPHGGGLCGVALNTRLSIFGKAFRRYEGNTAYCYYAVLP